MYFAKIEDEEIKEEKIESSLVKQEILVSPLTSMPSDVLKAMEQDRENFRIYTAK